MRISDWSSDVCSSDLCCGLRASRFGIRREKRARRRGASWLPTITRVPLDSSSDQLPRRSGESSGTRMPSGANIQLARLSDSETSDVRDEIGKDSRREKGGWSGLHKDVGVHLQNNK